MRLLSRVLVASLVLAVAAPAVSVAQEPGSNVLDWESGRNKSYLIPALEIPAFIVGLNGVDRLLFPDSSDYDVDGHSFEKNLTSSPRYDRDPFSVNQIGHPYQGGIYYGLARSAGLGYWESLLYTLAGSYLWETFGETTRPSINDHISTGIGGSFVGEALFRMSSL